ncbi:hypothetical protein SAMN05421856_104393 [Chryseobacterium taichungense]|uniref:Uncharacterized protein n=1 Tax=Chryseobacterium taichungense TaxID=295069 RepID=A0A1H7ZMS8_9FLAO|nr:hypothetical protein SAMN05421856_104393 [Chryseobacterium taichungense]
MNRYNHPVKNSLNFRHPSKGWEFPGVRYDEWSFISTVYSAGPYKRSGFVKLKAAGIGKNLSGLRVQVSVGSYKRSGFVKLKAQCIKKNFVHFVFNK